MNLIKNSQENFFNQFQRNQQGSKNKGPIQNLQEGDLVNENDEALHDEVEAQVASCLRVFSELNINVGEQIISDIDRVIDNFHCMICQSVVCNPVVVKHCLHFFCKQCIQQQVRSHKKECPLCKTSMRTTRELREYTKIDKIMQVLKPLIIEAEQKQEREFEEIKLAKIKEQQQMQKLRDEQIELTGGTMNKSKKKRSYEEIAMRESSLNEIVEKQDQEDAQEQERIKRKVEKLRQREEQQKNQMQSLAASFQPTSSADIQTMINHPYATPEEIKFYQDYNLLKQQASQASNPFKRFKRDPPNLDLKVRILFDENLEQLVFPKVKEFQFRIASSSPLEVAAKTLANKNMHPHKWRDYSFSYVKKAVKLTEILVENLQLHFGELKEEENQQELLLFYKVKDLQQFDYRNEQEKLEINTATKTTDETENKGEQVPFGQQQQTAESAQNQMEKPTTQMEIDN